MTTKRTLFEYLDSLPDCTIYGLQIQSVINAKTGKQTFASTILAYMREYADIAGAGLVCESKSESRYHFTPGIKISGAIGYNIE